MTTRTIKVSSTPGIHSPGVWRWFESEKRNQPEAWSVEFLRAFTCDRLTVAECQRYLQGKLPIIASEEPTDDDNPTLVLTISSQRIVGLTCHVCGESCKGRQWWNRDTGFGTCTPCGIILEQQHAAHPSWGPAEDLTGKRGIHWDVKQD
jgi:hypothetical protein